MAPDAHSPPLRVHADGGGELRWNPLTQRWVVIAPVRAARPVEEEDANAVTGGTEAAGEEANPARAREGGPENARRGAAGCPFCPGNEGELPGILMETPSESVPGWSFRAVPNRFAAFGHGGSASAPGPSGAPVGSVGHPARGSQEVLIESPVHVDDLSTMDGPALRGALGGYHTRYAAMAARPEVSRVILFRNRGRNAGNSLRHPHAQLVGLELDPPEALSREAAFRELRRHFSGACPLCDPRELAPGFADRLLRHTRSYACWVPWAAEAPFEVWIAPRRHVPDFRDSGSEDERSELAELLGWVARRYRDAAGDPDYNLMLHSPGPRDPDPSELHWWIRMVPRIGRHAGLELLTGVRVNPSSPEQDAVRLSGNSSPPPA